MTDAMPIYTARIERRLVATPDNGAVYGTGLSRAADPNSGIIRMPNARLNSIRAVTLHASLNGAKPYPTTSRRVLLVRSPSVRFR